MVTIPYFPIIPKCHSAWARSRSVSHLQRRCQTRHLRNDPSNWCRTGSCCLKSGAVLKLDHQTWICWCSLQVTEFPSGKQAKSFLVGGWPTPLKNDGVRQWEGWHAIYEMENNPVMWTKPPSRFWANLGSLPFPMPDFTKPFRWPLGASLRESSPETMASFLKAGFAKNIYWGFWMILAM